MFEVDYQPVGSGTQNGDAIAVRFTRPDTGRLGTMVIDAGWPGTGHQLVEFVQTHYETDTLDLLVLTHPDGDHIGGMGEVLDGLQVTDLWVHDLAAHGGGSLRAAEAVTELRTKALAGGTRVFEPFAGRSAFGDAVQCLGPSESYYNELVDDQVAESIRKALTASSRNLREAALNLADRFVGAPLGIEVPLYATSDPGPRNHSSAVLMLSVDGERMLFCGDAGIPALDGAWDYLEHNGMDVAPPDFVHIAHHGSRRNATTELLDRVCGPTGSVLTGVAFVSCTGTDPKHPSARVINAYMKRGYRWQATAGRSICHRSPDAPMRTNWHSLPEQGPLDESGEE